SRGGLFHKGTHSCTCHAPSRSLLCSPRSAPLRSPNKLLRKQPLRRTPAKHALPREPRQARPTKPPLSLARRCPVCPCSSCRRRPLTTRACTSVSRMLAATPTAPNMAARPRQPVSSPRRGGRSEEHTSELQSP